MTEAEVGLRASLKDRAETAAGLKSIKGDVEGVGAAAEVSGARARVGARGFDALGRAGKIAGVAMKAGFGLVLAAGYATVKLLRASFDEARESQKVGARTVNVLKTTGAVANITAKQVGKLSTAISLKSGIDDEAIQTGANLLLTFKNIRNEAGKGNDVFNQTTQAAVDLSAAGFGSIESSSKMLGKALNDPLKGLTALGRAGVTFTADQQKQITTLVGQNKLLDAQKIILGEVQSQVGGAAAAQATWGEKAKVLWQNVEENIGTALLPVLDDVERWFVRKGGPAVNDFVSDFQNKGVPAIKDFIHGVRPLANQILPATATALGDVRDVLKEATPYVTDIVEAFNNMPDWAKKGTVVGALGAVAAYKTGALGKILGSKGGGGLVGAVTSKTVVPVFVTNEGFGGGGDGVLGKGGKVAAGAAGLSATAAVGAGAVGVGFLTAAIGSAIAEYRAPSQTIHDQAGAPQHAAGSNPAGTATLTAPKGAYGGYDNFNQMLEQQKLASKYQFDFNTELQNTQSKLDLNRAKATLFGGVLKDVASTKVDPPVTTPGLPRAQTGISVFDTALDRVGRGATAHVNADTRAAVIALNNLNAFKLADKYIHVHLDHVALPHLAAGGPVIAGHSYVVGEQRPELFVPSENGRIVPSVPSRAERALPRVDVPDVDLHGATRGRPITVHNQVILDGKVVHDSVAEHAESQDARR